MRVAHVVACVQRLGPHLFWYPLFAVMTYTCLPEPVNMTEVWTAYLDRKTPLNWDTCIGLCFTETYLWLHSTGRVRFAGHP
jgi:hypothetical protein